MTEREWATCDAPKWMLDFVQRKTTARKTRLFACACCNRLEASFIDSRTKAFVDAVERFADGLIGDAELDRAYFAAREAAKEKKDNLSDSVCGLYGVCADYDYEEPMHGITAERAAYLVADDSPVGYEAERQIQASLLRDVVGNPYCPITLDPRWLTATVVDLARAIYADRAFDRLPILAGALMDAGCDDELILAHCRSDGPHVRGCWVVDLILGKE